ncbi:hypothetical protein D3C84_888320 [compost metagenome]
MHRCALAPHQGLETAGRFGKRVAVGDRQAEIDARLDFIITDADHFAILQGFAVALAQANTGLDQFHTISAVIG